MAIYHSKYELRWEGWSWSSQCL